MDKKSYPFFAFIYPLDEPDEDGDFVMIKDVITNELQYETFLSVHKRQKIVFAKIKWSDTKGWGFVRRIKYGIPGWLRTSLFFIGANIIGYSVANMKEISGWVYHIFQ